MAIKENLLRIRENIEKTCLLCGRDPREVKLLAVSKTFRFRRFWRHMKQGNGFW